MTTDAAIPRPPAGLIKAGSADAAAVRAIQRALNRRGCGPIDEDGAFGPRTTAAVRLFQARFPDADGVPLKVDGVVGPITWATLFGSAAPAAPPPADGALLARVLDVARGQIGVMEEPPGSNRGRQVDEYLRRVRLDPARGSYPWCAAFVYWCFDEAARAAGIANPAVRTAGVHDFWRKAKNGPGRTIPAAQARAEPSLVRPGAVFLIRTSSTSGHMGLVEGVAGGKLITIEGNTNDGGSREGIGVFRRDRRKIADMSLGFVDYGS